MYRAARTSYLHLGGSDRADHTRSAVRVSHDREGPPAQRGSAADERLYAKVLAAFWCCRFRSFSNRKYRFATDRQVALVPDSVTYRRFVVLLSAAQRCVVVLHGKLPSSRTGKTHHKKDLSRRVYQEGLGVPIVHGCLAVHVDTRLLQKYTRLAATCSPLLVTCCEYVQSGRPSIRPESDSP